MNVIRFHLVVSLLLTLTMHSALSTPSQTIGPADSQVIVKDEVVGVTPPPECKYDFEVFSPKDGETPSKYSLSLLESLGIGVAGLAEGSGLKVKCADTGGSGWIDRSGELQSFIVPQRGWFSERSGRGWKAAGGKLHVITKRLPFEGKDVEGTYVRFVGASLSEYSKRLLQRLGIGIAGIRSTVLVRLNDGRKRKGTLTAEGVVTITTEPWED